MSKRIVRINALQYSDIVNNAKRSKTFIAEIDGNDIKNLNDYLSAVWQAFRFPQTGHVNYYAYLDWIRDLDWLGADAYIFAIRNFDCFMKQSPKEKQTIISSLENTVIPWWESEIEQFQVGGKAKPFMVYLVD